MKKGYFFFLFFIFQILTCSAGQKSDSLIALLDAALEDKQQYANSKIQRIDMLNKSLVGQSKSEQYQIYSKIFENYKSFIYDSAFACTRRMLAIGYELNDKVMINNAKVKVSFTLLSAGMFAEALDTLSSINHTVLSKEDQIEYFSVYSRTYFDMSDYSQDQYYTQIYSLKGNELLKNAIDICEPGSPQYLFLKGWEYMRFRNIPMAISTYEEALQTKRLTEHQVAIVSSSLSYMYKVNNQLDKAEEYLVKSAIADIHSAIRETVAIRDLAEILYHKKDIERASVYIKAALDDAYFYGAKHRKIQIANIHSLIESSHLNLVELKRKSLIFYSLILTLVSILVIGLSVAIYRKNKKLKIAQNELSESHKTLQDLNEKLQDANTIKDEYIGYFLKSISDYVNRIEKFKNSIDRKLSMKKPDEIRDVLNSINLKSEREHLYQTFDSIFLKIFPGFIDEFNSLLDEKEHYVIGEKDPLPTELRIFALIRLGINDNEKIARILDYSVNTIYTYKTKTKNKSIIPNEKFEERIMQIKTV